MFIPLSEILRKGGKDRIGREKAEFCIVSGYGFMEVPWPDPRRYGGVF